MTKKKQVQVMNYKKGTESSDKSQIIEMIKDSTHVYVLQQAVYSDDSQSITVQIHFKPKL